MPSPSLITYTFELADGTTWSTVVDLNRASNAAPPATAAPEWTRLGFKQCQNCPLPDSCERCPPALDAAPLLERFATLRSFSRLKVTVVTPERTYVKEADAQLALKSALGLIMATSACPVLKPLRSQAHHHLPFATADESIYRAVGDYLIKQVLISHAGGQPDFALAGLNGLYQELAELNGSFFQRIQAVSPSDSNANAIVALTSMSHLVSMTIEDCLGPLREALPDA